MLRPEGYESAVGRGLRREQVFLRGIEGGQQPPLVSPFVPTRDCPPFVNGVEGGAVTPRRGAGRAGQCVAVRAAGCRPSIAPGRARRWSQPRPVQTSSKRMTASPRRPLPGFEGAESLASPWVIPRVSWLSHLTSGSASPTDARETLDNAARLERFPRCLAAERTRGRANRRNSLGDGRSSGLRTVRDSPRTYTSTSAPPWAGCARPLCSRDNQATGRAT